jgi:hypothetical protein
MTIEPGVRDVEIPWTLFRKTALVLFGISLLSGLASTAIFMGHRQPVETWRIAFILALVLLTIASTILISGVLLPNSTSPHPEFLSCLVLLTPIVLLVLRDVRRDRNPRLRYGGVARFIRPGS